MQSEPPETGHGGGGPSWLGPVMSVQAVMARIAMVVARVSSFWRDMEGLLGLVEEMRCHPT